MKYIRMTALLVALSGSLAACGNMNGDPTGFNVIGGVITGLISGDSAETQAGTGLTREAIEAQDVNLLRVSIISREATGLLTIGGRNGDQVTWVSPEGLGMTFDKGLLTATRGLGDDLMGSDLTGAHASLNGGGNHRRTLEFLNGLGQIERLMFQCVTVTTKREALTIFERTYATTVLEETCTSEIGSFKNTYWRDSDGVIWQARQWISVGVGYLGYQRL